MDKNRCVEADSAYITFYKKPNIFIGNDTLLYGSDKIEIIPDLSIPTNKAGLKWSPKTLLSCDTCFSQYFSINKSELISVIYKDLNGCLASDSIFIDYIKEGAIAFPSAFSPNGDFKNDVFTYNGEGVKKIQYKIFNRWGEKVFESNSIEDKWDGTYKNEPQPNENYVYVSAITLINNKVLVLKGSVALIR
jgi:gliding motility-associated-like protein